MEQHKKDGVIKILKNKFSEYNQFYIADTMSLSPEQVAQLRKACTKTRPNEPQTKSDLVQKALEDLQSKEYNYLLNALTDVTALLFTSDPKKPALLLCSAKDTPSNEEVIKTALVGNTPAISTASHRNIFLSFSSEATEKKVVEKIVESIRETITPVATSSSPQQVSADDIPTSTIQWKTKETINSQILEVGDTTLILECLVDPVERTFENRRFDKDLFSHLPKVDPGTLVLIEIFSRPGEILFRFSNGEGIVEPSIFEVAEDFSDLANELHSLSNL